MANWMMNVHARWLAKVHERMKVELLSHVRIHADETTVQVLKEPNREAKKKSRMWLFCSARCNVPVYVFEYHETRRKGVAQEFLAGWSGTLTTDGYKPYFNLGNPNIANTACLVHVRRYFAQIVKIAGGDAKAASAASVALEARRRIDAMFKVCVLMLLYIVKRLGVLFWVGDGVDPLDGPLLEFGKVACAAFDLADAARGHAERLADLLLGDVPADA